MLETPKSVIIFDEVKTVKEILHVKPNKDPRSFFTLG